MRKKIGILILVFFAVSFNSLWAYHGDVHKKIDEYATDPSHSRLDQELREQLGIVEGVGAELKKDNESKTIKEWIAYGGEAEDYGWPFNKNWLATRGFNHFHDPLKDWNEAGLDNDVAKLIYHGSYFRYPVSSILWGLKPGEQDFFWNFTGDWSWGKAREYYYNALTKESKDERNQNFADCFRAVGQVLHLLQDASVPLHTRNDVHVFPLLKIPGTKFYLLGKWNYETYTKEYLKDEGEHKLDFIPDQPSDRPDPVLLTDPQPDPNYSNIVPISGLFDRNRYNAGATSPPHDNTIGLAEYSNANFLTDDTMWKYQHPRKEDTTYQEIDWLNPEQVVAEDGDTDFRLYIKYKDGIGEDIDHLAAVDYWFEDYVDHLEIEHGLLLDKLCFKDYAAKLIPRAVGYSAALLNYFFRGKLQVMSLPILSGSSITALRLKIKNITPSEEAMTNGHFVLVCRYTPTGGNPDGSDDIFLRAPDFNFDELQYEDQIDILFELPEPKIPIENYDSVECILAFQGTLGNEAGAVIGKSFLPLIFIEEWDNSFDGNYPWLHTTADQNPDNGSTSNVIQNDILIKDNIRFIGYDTPRCNESYLQFADVGTNNPGLLITPNADLHFKIDELSINEIPPAPPGETTNLQALMLHFNNGLTLQFSQAGQFMYWNPTTAYYTFSLGMTIIDNIYLLFQNAGIEIPEPLYLKSINFIQQLLPLEEPSTVEHHQHMEVDFIKIIKGDN